MQSMVEKRFLHYLFSLAWSDEEFQDQEKRFLARLVSTMELDEETAGVVDQWFDAPPADEADWSALSMDYALRDGLMRQALLLSGTDKVVRLSEMKIIERLRLQLGFDDESFSALVNDVERIWREQA
jgi:hypothetical protein